MNPIKNKNRMKKNILLFGLIGALTAMLAAVSCKPDYETEFEVKTLVVPDKDLAPVSFDVKGGTHEIVVETNVALSGWSASSNAEWLKVDKKEGKVTLSAGASDEFVPRIARVTIEYGHQTYSIDVTQAAKADDAFIPNLSVVSGILNEKDEDGEDGEDDEVNVEDTIRVRKYGGTISVKMKTNMKEFLVLTEDIGGFVRCNQSEKGLISVDNEEMTLSFEVNKSYNVKKRHCTVTFYSLDNDQPLSSFCISQEPATLDMFTEIPLTVDMLSTNAQEPTEGPIANLVDGNTGNFFHTAWTWSINEAHYFQVTLDEPVRVGCIFKYWNRNNANGKPQDVSIMISADGKDWSELAHLTSGLPTGWASTYESDYFPVDEPFKYFRFVVNKTNAGTAPTSFSLAEFKLYCLPAEE
jgi:hypothetical protein